MIVLICKNSACNLPFIVKPYRKKKAKYCSHSCYSLDVKPIEKLKQGYRRIRINGKLVYLHRYIYEQNTGEKLTEQDIIHHKNGNKFDNRFENLEKLSGRAAHLHKHNYYRKQEKEWFPDNEIPF